MSDLIDNTSKSYFQQYLDDHPNPVLDMLAKASFRVSLAIMNYRKENSLSQSDFAREMDISQPMVSKMESGEYNFSLEQMCKLAVAMGKELVFNDSDDVFKVEMPYSTRNICVEPLQVFATQRTPYPQYVPSVARTGVSGCKRPSYLSEDPYYNALGIGA